MTRLNRFLFCLIVAGATTPLSAEGLSIDESADRIVIRDGDRTIGEYRYRDEEIPRPYFCQMRAPCGVPVTRSHPPDEQDLADHATFHPGIWVAFGDLSGADSWRLKARVEHVEFVEGPRVDAGAVTFTVRNRYTGADGGESVCDEVCRWTLVRSDPSYLLTMDSRFSSDSAFTFGDQEEMGLGVRLATPIAENQNAGGLLTDSESQRTAAEVWGKQAAWCDYSGVVDGQPVGVTIMAHPENIRRSWWHARDYGFVAANPFGRKAFTGGEPSRVVVEPGAEFRLRYRVVIHDERPGAGYEPAAAYVQYVAESGGDENRE